jgi:predicted unusual protein kinase regulating ubiquinone biosynthesis (AarF/ABC1/UbiB family)
MSAPRTSESRIAVIPGKRAETAGAPVADPAALKGRNRRVMGYFTRVALHFLWWDCILKWRLLRGFRTPWEPRWRRFTREYKTMALDLQGLWVKLGQFLSTRVDLLPLEITTELDSLRDDVPPVPFEAVVAQIESEFGCPCEQIFTYVSPRPAGSASLAQVHRARTAAGDAVVVKVLRPGIRECIRADLRSLRRVIGLLGWVKPITRRANLDAVLHEFEAVTANELDLVLEAQNIRRFGADFADDLSIGVPRIYKDHSSQSVLTMEDVSFIPIDDVGALEQAGINRHAVAAAVYRSYLRQFFVTHRVHADPHPGNLFVRPLPSSSESVPPTLGASHFQPGDPIPFAANRPFQVVFVDFGMFVEIPPRLRAALRDFAVGLGLRDARLILDSYARAGVVQPGADLDRLEEMIQEQLDELWGTFLGQMRYSDLTGPAAAAFFEKYAELMSATPFQFQSEMLFVMRAMGILSGLTCALDPAFDPAAETAPFAQKLLREDVVKDMEQSVQQLMAGQLPPSLLKFIQQFTPLPRRRSAPTRESTESRDLRGLHRTVERLTICMAACGLLALGIFVQSKGVRVSTAVQLLWAGDNLGGWLIEIAGLATILTLLRRKS